MQQARHFGRKFALQILLVFGDKFQFNNRAQTSVLGANRRYIYIARYWEIQTRTKSDERTLCNITQQSKLRFPTREPPTSYSLPKISDFDSELLKKRHRVGETNTKFVMLRRRSPATPSNSGTQHRWIHMGMHMGENQKEASAQCY